MKRYLAALTVAACLMTTACNDWERTTFQVLAADKAVIDDAAAGYEARTLPHTSCVKSLIEKARAADAIAVQAMSSYEYAKLAKTPTDEAQATVGQALANLVPVLANIRTLSTLPCGGGK